MKSQHGTDGGEKRSITRRKFLGGAVLAAAGAALASAGPGEALGIPLPHQTYLPQVTGTGLNPGSYPMVAIAKVLDAAQAPSYERALVKKQVQAVLDGIGGIADVAQGKKVGIKVNLTGGAGTEPSGGPLAIESYITHPEVVRALCELLQDAGATHIYILESAYEPASWAQWKYNDIVQGTATQILDLTIAPEGGDSNYVDVPTSPMPYYYASFKFHPILAEIDSLVSVSKMKCHNIAGVTHTLKNLFGLVPYRFYNSFDPNYKQYRSDFHSSEPGVHVPGTIIDMNSARRVNLSLVDGIMAAEGGEGPWVTYQNQSEFNQVKPGILIAGKDPVATDSVATACMGFDPTADFPNPPFVNGVNHIAMAARRGMGTNQLSQIQVVGEKIADVKMNFAVSY